MPNIKKDNWGKYGGWIFVIPLVSQLIWGGINGQSFNEFFVEVYLFGGFMSVVALFCAGKISSR